MSERMCTNTPVSSETGFLTLFRSDEIAEAAHVQRWFSSERCLNWIRKHKSTSLLSTELVNYTHTGLDPLGVAFALGGTLVNVLVIFLLLPMRERTKRNSTVLKRLTAVPSKSL